MMYQKGQTSAESIRNTLVRKSGVFDVGFVRNLKKLISNESFVVKNLSPRLFKNV